MLCLWQVCEQRHDDKRSMPIPILLNRNLYRFFLFISYLSLAGGFPMHLVRHFFFFCTQKSRPEQQEHDEQLCMINNFHASLDFDENLEKGKEKEKRTKIKQATTYIRETRWTKRIFINCF